MYPKHNYSRVVGFHPGSEAMETLGYVPTVLIFYVTLYNSFTCILPYYISTLRSYAPISAPASIPASIDLAAVIPPYMSRSTPPLSHRRHVTRATVHHSASIHIFSIWQVMIYWEMVLWWLRKYESTSSITNTTITASRGMYFHLPTMYRFVWITARCKSTLCWNLPRVWPIQGITTKVSETIKRVAWVTTF